MEEIVKEIRAIKHLVALAAFSILFFVLGSLAQTMFAYQAMEPAKTWYNKPEVTTFINTANDLINNQNYDELIKIAGERAEKLPNDPYGHYYLGLAHYHKAEYGAAVTSLERAEQLAPTWKERDIEPYLDAAKKAVQQGSK
jgi:uncharacterized protein HemY